MSVVTLERSSIHWSDAAREALGQGTEKEEAWFEDFDRALSDVDLNEALSVREEAETWYVINDMDVTFPRESPLGQGLDSWDF
jgi:hypothetical protein